MKLPIAVAFSFLGAILINVKTLKRYWKVGKMIDDKLVRQTVYYPANVRQQLKLLAVKYDMTISEVATKAVELLLKQEKDDADLLFSDSKAKLDDVK